MTKKFPKSNQIEVFFVGLSAPLRSADLPTNWSSAKLWTKTFPVLVAFFILVHSRKRSLRSFNLNSCLPKIASYSRSQFFKFTTSWLSFASSHKKSPDLHRSFVIPLGLEPRAHTLKVYCSTNWATESNRLPFEECKNKDNWKLSK